MIDLGTTDFYIAVSSMPRREFERYSMHLFDEWEKYLVRKLNLPDYSLALEVEEGSVKGAGKIAAALGALYIGIGNYGSFISGLQLIRDQISEASDFLTKRAGAPFESSGVKPNVRKRGGSLASLQRLFVKVQRGEMTPDQAMQEAKVLFGDEAVTAPEFMQKLEESFDQTLHFHKQLPLPFFAQEDGLPPSAGKGKVPRPSPYKPNWPPPPQFRIEVWRESKKEKRNVRVVTL